MNYQEIANLALKKLNDDNSWEKNYNEYSKEIAQNEEYVKAVCESFKPKAPITKYLSIGMVKDVINTVKIDLRIMGISVSTISVKPDKGLRNRIKSENLADEIQKAATVTFNEAGLNKLKGKLPEETQGKLNEFIPNLLNEENNTFEWNSTKLKKFRSLMKTSQDKDEFDISEEHTVETLFLNELSKTSSSDKYLLNIQPCRICGQYYQFITPLTASNAKNDKLDISHKGGGIDILARYKYGNESTICVIELKDKYEKSESPEKAIKQAIAYAAFIIKLIRSAEANGAWWYKNIMGINKELAEDKPIKVYAVIAMPYQNENAELPPEDTDFINEGSVKVGNDEIHLHYIYFKKEALNEPQIPNGFTCSFIKSQF